MASRQEEKEARRQERLKAEAADARIAARRRRLQMVFGGVLALGLVGAVVAVAAFGLLGSDDDAEDGRKPVSTNAKVQLPAPVTTDLEAAVEAAGCELQHPKYEGAGHAEKDFKAADYKTNPPTSGEHFPEWYEDGVYEPGATDNLGMTVHALEHGRINVQYKPGTPQETVDKLEAFWTEKTGYHILVFENQTNIPYEVAATAWTQLLGCKDFNDKGFDALRTFYARYVDKGPEKVP